MKTAPQGQRWLPKQRRVVESIESGLEVCGVELERRLARHPLGDRWLAREVGEGTPRLAYRIDMLAGSRTSKSFRLASEMLVALRHRHVLPVLRIDPSRAGGRWLISPYPGNSAGVVTLADVALQRDGGCLKGTEVGWVVEQTLEAAATAQRDGHCHGEFRANEIVVDRRGSVQVELYGAARRLRGCPAADGVERRAETRSIAELGYRLLTGAAWDGGESGGGRSLLRGHGGLGRWLEAGLAGEGFSGASEALAALRGEAAGSSRVTRRRAG